ncbi:hypothetical protein ACWDKQ_31900 [Saccharopolyspora sp. NPDC000995]
MLISWREVFCWHYPQPVGSGRGPVQFVALGRWGELEAAGTCSASAMSSSWAKFSSPV